MKTTSAGVIITDGSNYLICHPTHGKYWDIPKGKQDPGESLDQTAVRELKEETNYSADITALKYLGTFPYRVSKDLAIFLLTVEEMPDPKDLHCESTFKDGNEVYSEMDAFMIVDRDTMFAKVNPSMQKVFSKIF